MQFRYVIADGTSSVGEGMDLSWLWWIPAVLVGLVVLTFLVGTIVRRAMPAHTVPRGEQPTIPEARASKVRDRTDA